MPGLVLATLLQSSAHRRALVATYLGAMPEPCFRIEATLNQSELTKPNSLSTESLELFGYRNML